MRFVETIPIAKSSRVGISKEVPKKVSTTHMLEQFIATQAKAIVKATFGIKRSIDRS